MTQDMPPVVIPINFDLKKSLDGVQKSLDSLAPRLQKSFDELSTHITKSLNSAISKGVSGKTALNTSPLLAKLNEVTKEANKLYEAYKRVSFASDSKTQVTNLNKIIDRYNYLSSVTAKLNKDKDGETVATGKLIAIMREEATALKTVAAEKVRTAALAEKAAKDEVVAQKAIAKAIKETAQAAAKPKKTSMTNADIMALPTRDITSIRLYSRAIGEATSAIYNMSKAENRNEAEIKQLTEALNQASKKLQKFKHDNDRSGASMEKNVGIIANWYNHFGRVALGFTVAYRAMNAFESGMRNTFNLIKEGILLSGELTSLQAELATYYVLNTGNVNDFSEAMGKAAANVQALAVASLQSVSTLDELSVGISELAQHNVLISPDNMKSFSAINDLLIQVAKATGDNAKQIRSEWGGLMDGQMKATNAFVRMLSSIGILDEQMIKSLKGTGDKAKIVEEIFKKTEAAALRLQETLMRTNPALGFEKWKSSFSVAIAGAVKLASESVGTQNIFGDILAKHIKDLNKTLFNKDEQASMAESILLIAEAFDKSLTVMEKFIRGLLDISAWISQNRETLISFGKIIATYYIFKEVGIFIGGANLALKTFLTSVKAAPTILAGLIAALTSSAGVFAAMAMTAASLFSSIKAGIKLETNPGKIKELREEISALEEEVDNISGSKAITEQTGKFDIAVKALDERNVKIQALYKEVNTLTTEQKRLANLSPMELATDAFVPMIEGAVKGIGKVVEVIGGSIFDGTKKTFANYSKDLGDFLVLPPGKRKEIVESYEDALKEIGDLTTNFFSKLEKAIADSDFAAFDKLLAPTTTELEINLRETREEYEKLLVLAAATPEGLLKDKLDLKGLETAEKLEEIQAQYDGLASSMEVANTKIFEEGLNKYLLEALEKDIAATKEWTDTLVTGLDKVEQQFQQIKQLYEGGFFGAGEAGKATYDKIVNKLFMDYVPEKKETIDEYKKWWDSLDGITQKALENIHDSISGFFSKAFRGELAGASDVFKELMFILSDNAAQDFAKNIEKALSVDFTSDLGEFFTTILDDFGLTAGQAVNSLAAVIATAYSAVGMAKKDAALSGAITGAQVGGQTGNGYAAAAGLVIGGAAGYLLGDNGPSYGEQLGKAMEALAEKTDLNTTATQILTKEMLAGKDYSAGGLIEKYFNPKLLTESVFGDRSLMENLALPLIEVLENGLLSIRADFTDKGTRNQELIYRAFDRSGLGDTVTRKINLGGDYGRRNANADEINTMFTSLFDATSKEGIGGLVRVVKALDSLTSTGDVTLLFDELAKLPEYSAIGAENIRELFRAFEPEYESGAKVRRNTKNATEDVIADVWATIENEVTASFLSLIPTLEGLGEQYDVALAGSFTDADGVLQHLFNTAFTAKDKAIKSVDDTFEDVKTEVDNLKALSASGLINLDPKIQAFIDNFDGAIKTIKQGIEEFYAAARAETLSDMAKDIAIATGTMSQMEQAFLGIRETGEKYIDQLIDEGMAKDAATAKGEAYIKTLQKEAFQKQWNADTTSYETRILQAKIDAATALGKTDELQILNQQMINKNRKEEVLGLIETYKYGTPAFEAMHDLAKETWAFEDAARNAAAAMAGMWNEDSILEAKQAWISVLESLGEAVTPKFFLDSIGLGTDSGLEHLLSATTSDEVHADLTELITLYRTGVIKQDDFNSILGKINGNAADIAQKAEDIAAAMEEASKINTQAGEWLRETLASYQDNSSGFDAELKSVTDVMEDFRDQLEATGKTVTEVWAAGGKIENELASLIRDKWLADLKDETAGPKSSYAELSDKRDELIKNYADNSIDIPALQSYAIDIQNEQARLMAEAQQMIADHPEQTANDPGWPQFVIDSFQQSIDYWGDELKTVNDKIAYATETSAEINAWYARESLALDRENLNRIRDTLYNITGDTDILWQQLLDLQEDWMKVDAQDYGAQYDILTKQNDILTQLRDIQKEQLEETIGNYNTLQDVILELQGGSLAPVQSKEFFDKRYAQLYSTAMETGKTEDVNALAGFINQYADFMKAYGDTNYKDFTAKIISDFEALQSDLSGGATLDDLNNQLAALNSAESPIVSELIRIGDILAGLTGSGSLTQAIAFDEQAYLKRYADVAAAVMAGQFASGLEHYQEFGMGEGRLPGFASGGTFIAGEQGMEAITIRPGSSASISNNSDTIKAISQAVASAIQATLGNSGGGSGPINITLQVDRHTFGQVMIDSMKFDQGVGKQIVKTLKAA